MQPEAPRWSPALPSRPPLAVCLVLAAAAGWILLPDLGHPYITRWDESVHLAVTRTLSRTPLEPRLYADPLYPPPQRDPWTETGVFLHKPTLPFWIGAALMHLTGVTPLALRLVSAFSAFVTALMIFLLARRVTGVPWALAAALAFLNLPIGWRMVQGYQFGDVTDCTLVACVSLSMWLLLRGAEEGGLGLFVASGAMVGVGYLCKSGLAFPPLGVAFALWLLGRAHLVSNRVSLLGLVAMAATGAAIAAPWNLYCFLRWPSDYHLEALHTANHFTGQGIEWWIRSPDALLNEINALEWTPYPVVLPLLAAGWLTWTALKTRTLPATLCALWVCSEWIVLSIAKVKVPATAWGAVPAVFAGLALLGRDGWRKPTLALTVIAATQVPWLMSRWPVLGHLRAQLPRDLGETATWPGLAEGLLALSLAVVVGGGLALVRGRRWAFWRHVVFGTCALASVFWLCFVQTTRARAEIARWNHDELTLVSYGRDLAVLDSVVPRKSVFFLDFAEDSRWSIESASLMFWTDRMAYRCFQDSRAAHAHGLHPYLVSTMAQPYRSLDEVPAGSWARAYDLEEPAPPPPLPAGVTPLNQRVGTMEVLGFAESPGDRKRDRYVFFLKAHGPPAGVRVIFHGKDGAQDRWLDPAASLESAHDLANAPWFMVPTTAQRRAGLTDLEFRGGLRVPLQ